MIQPTQTTAATPPATQSDRAVVFLSYAREDKNFVLRLAEALQLKGVDARGDWQLVRGENYEDQLHDLQLGADAIIFTLSPDSVRSGPCRAELENAAEQKKRILPVVCRDVGSLESELPKALSLPQWTFLRPDDDFITGVQGLVEAINTDFDLMPEHRRLLQAAEIWQRNGRSASYLLRKDGLKRTEDWLTKTGVDANKLPKPTALQLEYIRASRLAQTRGSRIAIVVISAVAVAMSVLAVVALIQRTHAKEQQKIAEDQRKEAEKQQGIAEGETKIAEDQTKIAEQRRKEAEEAIETERAAHAVDLAQQPGREMEALSAAVLAAGNIMKKANELPRPAVIEALAAATNAARYSVPLRGHTDEVEAAAFSPDGTRLLTQGKDLTAKLWDTSDGRMIASFQLHSHSTWATAQLSGASFSCDSQRVVTPHNTYRKGKFSFLAEVWSARTGAPLLSIRGHTKDVNSAFFSPDSSQIITASADFTVKLWHAETGQVLREYKAPSGSRLWGEAFYAVFSDNGNRIFTAHQDSNFRIWDAKTAALLDTRRGTHPVSTAAFYPDGNRVLIGGHVAGTSAGSSCVWRAAEVSPDGSRLFTRGGLEDTVTGKSVELSIYGKFGEDFDSNTKR